MRLFLSWAGNRSRALASAMQAWLPEVLGEIDIFHSDDIPKGSDWHRALVGELAGCAAGIFCIAPESLRSPWLMFEAGALAKHGQEPRLFTYLFGMDAIRDGPLSSFQATRFDRDESLKLAKDVAAALGLGDEEGVAARFEESWDGFRDRVHRVELFPLRDLAPGLLELFKGRKTFHESFPDCSDKRWDDRLERVVETRVKLTDPAVREVLGADAYLGSAYDELVSALDVYRMNIAAHLLRKREFHDLPEEHQRQLEESRQRVVDIVRSLEKTGEPPVFRESLRFEAESDAVTRKQIVQDMTVRLRSNALSERNIREARDSLGWGLDRIVFYVAVTENRLKDVAVEELVANLQIEEEQARTRGLVRGLQPLYYATEALDERLTGVDAGAHRDRILELLAAVRTFLEDHDERDAGKHVRSRLDSIRRKLGRAQGGRRPRRGGDV